MAYIRRMMLLVLLAVVCVACQAHKSSGSAPRPSAGPVWTSTAEPSPPGDTRWGPADERELLRSYR
jgi:hypothetical protein